VAPERDGAFRYRSCTLLTNYSLTAKADFLAHGPAYRIGGMYEYFNSVVYLLVVVPLFLASLLATIVMPAFFFVRYLVLQDRFTLRVLLVFVTLEAFGLAASRWLAHYAIVVRE
jgi:hypothetical protein